jgi:hypothetical protein
MFAPKTKADSFIPETILITELYAIGTAVVTIGAANATNPLPAITPTNPISKFLPSTSLA